MKNLNIGLIGYGHLGRALCKQADQNELEIAVSKGRGKNVELARESGVLLLTVKPGDVRAVLEEVRDVLSQTEVISFAAAVPGEAMQKWSGVHVDRAMTDISFQQIVTSSQGISLDVLSQLTNKALLISESDSDIDRFTALVGCLPGVSAWHFSRSEERSALSWLDAYTSWAHERFSISKEVLTGIVQKAAQDSNPGRLLASVATKGGVTEAMVQCLEVDRSCSFEELLTAGMDRIQKLAIQLT